jgi:hypothetical protein
MEFNQVKQKHHSIEQGLRLDLWALSNEPKNTQIHHLKRQVKIIELNKAHSLWTLSNEPKNTQFVIWKGK